MKILVGSAGTNAGYNFVLSIRRYFPEVEVVSMDVNPPKLVPSSLLSDHHVTSPYAHESEYEDFLRKLIEGWSIDLFVPINSFEIQVAHKSFKNISLLMTSNCKWLDKRLCNQVLYNNDLPVPVEINPQQDLGGEFFIKPVDGNGSHGARLIKGSEAALLDLEKNILQEKCAGPEITIDSLMYEGELVVRCRERLETKAGVCTKARVFWSDELFNLAKKLAATIEQTGLICFQIMFNASGEFVITDLNLRPGGGTAISCLVGGDLFAGVLSGKVNTAQRIVFPRKVTESFVCRQYSEFLTSANRP